MKKRSASKGNAFDRLTSHLTNVVDSFVQLLRSWRDTSPVTLAPGTTLLPSGRVHPAKPGKGIRQPACPFPWDEIVPMARRLLAADPRRTWRIGELCQAVRAAGVKVRTAVGMHFGLLPRLRESRLIVETGKGTFTFRAGVKPAGTARAGKVSAEPEAATGAPSRRPVRSRRQAKGAARTARQEPGRAAVKAAVKPTWVKPAKPSVTRKVTSAVPSRNGEPGESSKNE